MTKKYTIELTEAQDKALATVVFNQKEWIEYVVQERCRIAIEEIVASEVQRLLAAGQTITGSKDDIVLAADIETAAEKHARMEAEYAAELAAKEQG
jgi:aspartyl aminopeptidase